MLLSLKDCHNRCVSIDRISVRVCFKKVAFKHSGAGDLFGLQLESKFVTPRRVIFIFGYGDVPLSGILLKTSAEKQT